VNFQETGVTLLESVPGLDPADRTTLIGGGIESVEAYRVRSARQPGLLAQLFPGDAGARVRQALAARAEACRAEATTAQRQAEKIDRPWLRGHTSDILLALIVSVLLYGIFRHRPPAPARTAQQMVVIAPSGLAAFQVIRAEDIALRETATDKSALTSVASAVGRYAAEGVAKGDVLEESQLNSGRTLRDELNGRRVIQVKVQSSAVVAGLKLPVRVALLASPKINARSSGLLLQDVLLLATKTQADAITAVVALRDCDAKRLMPFLGFSELFVVGPPRQSF